MKMSSTIKAEQLARLRALRDTINRQTNHDRAERLRKQREDELVQDYWGAYAAKTNKRTGRGAR
jgi:hypothetical protein